MHNNLEKSLIGFQGKVIKRRVNEADSCGGRIHLSEAFNWRRIYWEKRLSYIANTMAADGTVQ